MSTADAASGPPITELSKSQRRVLGVLVEKAFTTPDAYPMTLKAITTGCNQKSNRDPITNYTEDAVNETLDQLRELGLIAVLHTESGRTERYRHYMRHRFTLSEPQLAILIELLLRGRQQPGELRSRASRMVAVDSLEQLREELKGLIDLGLVRANGPLERRGVEVDHNLYRPNEGQTMAPLAADAEADTAPAAAVRTASPPPQGPASEAIETLVAEQRAMRAELDALRLQVDDLTSDLQRLRSELGT